MSKEILEQAKRGVVRILARYLGEECARPASYMLSQSDFVLAIRSWLSARDNVQDHFEEDAWYVASQRKDRLFPKLTKATEGRFFLDEKEAHQFADEMTRKLGACHVPFKITIIIGK